MTPAMGGTRRWITHAVVAAALALLVFYTFFLAAPWFYARYLAPVEALVTIPMAALAVTACTARHLRIVDRSVALAAVALLALIGIGMTVPNVWRDPSLTPDTGLEGAKGYREAAQTVLESVPKGATVGSLQSGALSYYAAGTRVVNLDGVVDHEAADALREHRLGAFARARGVTAFADWAFNLDAFIERSGVPGLTTGSFHEIARADKQGDEAMVLYTIGWPR
jgi:hypothetical protein